MSPEVDQNDIPRILKFNINRLSDSHKLFLVKKIGYKCLWNHACALL